MKRLRLRGPLEKDIQAWILRSLGVEGVRVVVKDGVRRLIRTGIFTSRDGKVRAWRQNAGRPQGGDRNFRGAPAGTPDILACVFGVFLGIEVKRPGEKQNDAQRAWQHDHEQAGGVYAVVNCPDEARRVVDAIRARVEARTCTAS